MALMAQRGMPVRILDIAAGHGRYVLEAIEAGTIKPESVLLRDYSDINVEAGRALIREQGSRWHRAIREGRRVRSRQPGRSRTETDARHRLRPVRALPRQRRWCPRSLAGLAAAIPPGGYLIYTGQPWHPQLELIARALTSHRQGQAWIMRRRMQAEMDQLVAAAGFRKIEQRIDEWGIFTVSVAERIAS